MSVDLHSPTSAGDWAGEWSSATSVALLGTDRRLPGEPAIPALSDLLADARVCGAVAGPADELALVASALASVRRAGLTPGPALQADSPPGADDRPVLTVEASARWRVIVDEWPVLEDEFLVRVVTMGWRLPPDLLVAMLRRHRGDSRRRAMVVVAAGPAAPWLVHRIPALASSARPWPRGAASEGLGELPELPLPAALVGLLDAGDVHAFGGVLDDLRQGRVGPAHRAVLVNLFARVRPETLQPLADALEAVRPTSPTVGMTLALGDLCRTRAAMLQELA